MTEQTTKSHYTIIIGRETLERLAKRDAVTLTMEDGVRVTMIDADNFPRDFAEVKARAGR